MIKKMAASEKFIQLLMDGKFKKPAFIKMQQLGKKNEQKENIENNICNYRFFMNTSNYDNISRVKIRKYNGDNSY